MRRIELAGNSGKYALIENRDFALIADMRWRYLRTKAGNEYALTRVKDSAGNSHTIYMHRLILSAPQGVEVDHVNGNGLDNRRANLRLATRQENCRNKPAKRITQSGFKGVSFDRRRKRHPWSASIYLNRRRISLGVFASAEEAAHAYDAAAVDLFGDFAHLNFLLGHEA